MERTEIAKKLFAQAQRMTLAMAVSVLLYGAIAYYLIQIGKVGPAVLDAQIYPLVKYGALGISIMGILSMGFLAGRMCGAPQGVEAEGNRAPQKLFLRTILMSAGAELPVLLGMILVFLGHQIYDYVPFAAISLAGFAFAFPKKQHWSSQLGIDL